MNASLLPLRHRVGILLLIVAPILLGAEQQPTPAERLEHARQVSAERNRRLSDYLCIQTVDRRYFVPRHTKGPTPPCDRLRYPDSSELRLQSTERLRLSVKVSNGHEIGSWRGSTFTSRDIFDLIGGGAYGTGMIGGLYSDVVANAGGHYSYLGDQRVAGETLYEFTYQIPKQFSHYQVKAGSDWTAVAIHGRFWLDSNTFGLSRLLVEAADLPSATGECTATTTVEYEKVHVGTGDFLLPQRSLIRILTLDDSIIEVAAAYSGWQEYHGEATIHYSDQPVAATGRNVPALSAAPLPPGLPFSIALIGPVDTETAAAGDVVRARIRKPMQDPHSKSILVPAGALVQGRIIQMQHSFGTPRQFTIAIQLEFIEVNGSKARLYARVIASVSKGIFLSPLGQSPLVAAFPFVTNKNRYRVPAGYESKWITVERPEEMPENHGSRP